MANTKGTGKKPAKKAAEKTNKVVKFEKKEPKTQEPEFKGVIQKTKIPLKTDIPKIDYKKQNTVHAQTVITDGIQKANKDFINALQNLCPWFLDVVEIKDKLDDTSITGVSFSEKGVVLTAQIELTENGINSPLIINTPHIPFEGGGYCVPEYAKKLLDELKTQAVIYIESEKTVEQKKLFEGTNDE